jgi:hypothetical protein
MKIKEFIQKHNKIYFPFVLENFGISGEELASIVVEEWDNYENPAMVENMLIKNNEIKCEYYEICDTKYNRGKALHSSKLEDHCYYNTDSDQHISVFKHDERWRTNARNTSSVSCSGTYVSPDWIYIELDRESYNKSLKDALTIYKNFQYKEAMQLWFSGNRSVHIAVHAGLFGFPIGKQENVCGLGKLFYNIAHRICGDVRHNNGIVDPWLMDENELFKAYYDTFGDAKNGGDISMMKQKLENTDPNLYRVNSLIRQPWSKHEKTDKTKVLLDPETGTPKEKNKFDIDKIKPYLINWVHECYEPQYKKTPNIFVPDIDESLINNLFSAIDGYDPDLADNSGWINNLYSPFYEDSNPSVAVNVLSGYYKDFGDPTHSFGLVEFYSKLKGIEYDEAKRYIEENREK